MNPDTDYSEYYDFDHDVTIDLNFYLGLARESGSPVLELACGTGRVTLPLAKAGFEVYGIDISENMLEMCHSKVRKEGLEDKVHLTQANMSQFDLPYKDFKLAVIALRSYMLLLSPPEQLSCLQSIHKHMQAGGIFTLNTIAPDLERLSQEPVPFALQNEFDLPDGNHVLRKSRLVEHDFVRQVRQFEFKFEEYDQTGKLVRERIVPLYTRYTFRYELQYLLERTGFEALDVFRDYDRNRYNGRGEMIVVARKI